MKIAHLCLSCFYIDNRSYQENDLVRQHVVEGHEVLVLASTESHDDAGKLTYVHPSEYLGGEGAKVVRLPYSWGIPKKMAPKLRIFHNVYKYLDEFGPDVIIFHGACGWELITVATYVKKNPKVVFYVDSHEDSNNSARNFISREILHKIYYARVLRFALPRIKKVLCVSTEVIDFVVETYRVPRERLEFFPLGGNLLSDEIYSVKRKEVRSGLALKPDEIMLLQSGKQTRRKKLLESLEAFIDTPNEKLRLFIAGSIDPEIDKHTYALISRDSRIRYLGWQTPSELTGLLCATDIYLQPGTQSATMQQSLCCRCAVILDAVPAHKVYYSKNGWLIEKPSDLKDAFDVIAEADIELMKNNSYFVAKRLLDYRVLAKRVLS